MQRTTISSSEAAILTRVIQPDRHDLSLAAARVILKFQFNTDDRQRMHQLALKNQSGKLSSTEQRELDGYLRVGRLLDLLAVKARLSLNKRGYNS
jgi:hypothetical protein